jgi:hypothetical protein
MPTDPTIAWIIALVVCTIYGWIMHRRGAEFGRRETVEVIHGALELKQGMKLTTLLEAVDDYLVHVEEQERKDEEE